MGCAKSLRNCDYECINRKKYTGIDRSRNDEDFQEKWTKCACKPFI